MILDIEPLFEGISFNCISDHILSYTRWLNRRHELSYSETWRFRFRSFEEDIQSGFDSYNTNQYKLLEKYHGIRIVKHEITEPKEMYPLLEYELRMNRPLMILVDSFWIPWDVNYQIYHTRGHFFFALGYDKESGDIYCMDASAKVKATLPSDNFIKGFKSICYSYPIVGEDINCQVKWRDIIKATLKELVSESHNSFDEMKLFAQKLEEYVNQMNSENEKTCYDKLYNICNVLEWTSINRKLYAIALNYLAEQKSELSDISEEITMSAYNWVYVMNLVLKGLAAHNLKNVIEKICTRIIDISDAEKKIAYILNELCEEAGPKLPPKEIEEPAVSNNSTCEGLVQPIEIASHFNNKGLSYDFYKGSADLTGLGDYIQLTEPIGGELITSDQMTFRLPVILNGMNDNISCMGQILDIPRGKYSGIQLLGCAEWGEYVEKLMINYEDGQTENVTFGFDDFYIFDTWKKKINFNQKIVLKGRPIECTSGTAKYMDRDANIYGSCFKLNRNMFIDKIKLPDCPNIHIFSISMILMPSDK